MSARIELHFDGAIVQDHRVTLRTLAKTLDHLQSAIDRAYLDVKHGSVWKHARLRAADYQATDFLLNYPREGGFVLDMVSKTGQAIGNRIKSTLAATVQAAMNEGEQEATRLKNQVADRYNQVVHDIHVVRTFENLQNTAEEEMDRAYGERAIAKELDQILSMIRRVEDGESTLVIAVEVDGRTRRFTFNAAKAQAFHRAVAQRNLGKPVLYRGVLRSLDKGNRFSSMRGKFINAESRREITVHIADPQDFHKLHPYLAGHQKIAIIAAPVIEYGSFDPMGGDIFFIGLEQEFPQRRARLRDKR